MTQFLLLSSILKTRLDEVYPQWRIKGGADWATARGPQHLRGPQSLSWKNV